MKYIKRFNVLNEFNNFIFDDTNTPNVSLIEELELPENLAFISLIPHNYSNDYLTFIPVEDSTFGFSKVVLSYSLDDGDTWTELAAYDTTPTVTAGSKILWKNNTTLTPSSSSGISTFSSSKNFDVQGNIMSLYFGDDFASQTSLSGKDYAFRKLFNSSKVRNAENLVLPATTLIDYCYHEMFRSCTSLTSAPILPATTLKIYCYPTMFCDCTSLTAAPELPATTLKSSCYMGMFNGCTSLNYVKMLATNISASACLQNWINNVAASGTFVKAEGTEIPSGASGIPEGWTIETV